MTQAPGLRKAASSSAGDGSVRYGQSAEVEVIRARRSVVVAPHQPTMPRERLPRPRVSPHWDISESPMPQTVGDCATHEEAADGSDSAGAAATAGASPPMSATLAAP